MIKFKINKEYKLVWGFDDNTSNEIITTLKVVKRTEKTITVKCGEFESSLFNGKTLMSKRISESHGVEVVTMGNYSMAPSLWANKEFKRK